VLARAVVASALAAATGWFCVSLVAGADGILAGAVVSTILALSRLLRTVPEDVARWIGDSVHGKFGKTIAGIVGLAASDRSDELIGS